MAVTGKIFISYRREDAADAAGRIRDWLVQTQRVATDDVIMDVTSILPGANFMQVIEEKISQCKAMIVVISPSWLAQINTPAGAYLRAEAEAALRRNMLVIPVLVGGAQMPAAESLPPSLSPLTQRNAKPIRPDSFDYDMGLVRKALSIGKRRVSVPWVAVISGLLLVALSLYVLPQVVQGFGGPSGGQSAPTPTPTVTLTPAGPVAAAFAGTWLNDNPNTRDIPQLIITSSGQTLTVHGFGACSPTYCDWGTVSGNFAGEPFVVVFNFDGSRPDACCKGAPSTTLTLSFVAGDTSRLQVISQHTAGTITDVMHKGATVNASDFAGSWRNVDPNTGSWVRVDITLQGNTITAHFYGACSPTPCDAGSASASFAGNPVHLTLDNGFAVRNITLFLTAGALQVTTFTHFTDNSGRQDYTTQNTFRH